MHDCAERLGDRDLLVFRERRISARQLEEEVEQLALGLLSLGIQKGDKVAVWLPNLPETCVTELAIARVGAAMMAINTRYKASELEYVLRQSDSRALVLMPQFLTQDFLAVLRDVIPEISSTQPGKLEAASTPLLKSLVVLGESQPGMFTYAEVQQMGRDRLPELHSPGTRDHSGRHRTASIHVGYNCFSEGSDAGARPSAAQCLANGGTRRHRRKRPCALSHADVPRGRLGVRAPGRTDNGVHALHGTGVRCRQDAGDDRGRADHHLHRIGIDVHCLARARRFFAPLASIAEEGLDGRYVEYLAHGRQ